MSTEDTITIDDLVAEAHDEDFADDALDVPGTPGDHFRTAGDIQRLLILAAVATAEHPGPHGKPLCDWFDALGYSDSPGTVYTILNQCYDTGLLDRHEFVRAKHYTVGDADALDRELATYERTLRSLLEAVLAARDELDTDFTAHE